jgi:hypothetical protein
MTNMHPPGQRGEEFGSEQRVLHLATVSKKGAVQTPNFRRMNIIGHQLVNADWNKFTPTKAVNRNHAGLTQ